jgi:dTDP-4-amino-4,6-dideoxygalactose transaminase
VFYRYNNAFSQCEWALLPPSVLMEKETSYHLYALRIKNISEDQRNEIIQEISENEVAVNVHFIPLPMLTFFKDMGYDINNYPQAYQNYACEISLPIYPQLSDEEVDYVIQTVIKSYEKVIKKS